MLWCQNEREHRRERDLNVVTKQDGTLDENFIYMQVTINCHGTRGNERNSNK